MAKRRIHFAVFIPKSPFWRINPARFYAGFLSFLQKGMWGRNAKTCLRVLKIVFPGKESWIEAPKMCHYASENNTLYAEIAKFPHPQSSVFAFLKCHFHIPKVALSHTKSGTFAYQKRHFRIPKQSMEHYNTGTQSGKDDGKV